MKTIKFMMALTMLMTSILSYAGAGGGNGGSGTESQNVALQAQLETVALKIRSFFMKNEVVLKSHFPEFDIQKLVKKIKQSEIRVVDRELIDRHGKKRTCLNYSESSFIECNQSGIELLLDKPLALFVLVFHECLGLIEAEETVPNDPLLFQGYSISKRIAPYVSKVNDYDLVLSPKLDHKLKVGDRVSNSYYRGGPSAHVVTTLIDADEVMTVSVNTSPELWANNEEAFKMEYISKEVESIDGVKKGLSAICKHLHGQMRGTVAHVYANGYVEIDHSSTTYATVGLYMPTAKMSETFWSSVPGKPNPTGYPCKYFAK